MTRAVGAGPSRPDGPALGRGGRRVNAENATFTVKAEVKVKASAAVGSSLAATLTAKSTADPAFRDTVKFVTSRA